jgi:cytochrome c553
MRYRVSLFALAVSGLLAGYVDAVNTSAAQNKLELCASCHGKDGVSRLPNTPSLAGQPDQYLQWQLVYFRADARKSDQMSGVAAGLSIDEIRNLAGYYASLPPPAVASDDDPVLSEAGAKIAAQSHCTSCHTDSFAGTRAVARLAHQREDYLQKALTDYKSSIRSGGGQAAMAEVAYPLTEDQIKALAHYLAHFQ